MFVRLPQKMLVGDLLWFSVAEDYLKVRIKKKRLEDKMCMSNFINDSSVLVNTHESIRNKLLQGDLLRNTLYHSSDKDPIYVRFYFLPKACSWLCHVSVRPSISDCGYYTENASSILDYYFKSLVQEVKSYI